MFKNSFRFKDRVISYFTSICRRIRGWCIWVPSDEFDTSGLVQEEEEETIREPENISRSGSRNDSNCETLDATQRGQISVSVVSQTGIVDEVFQGNNSRGVNEATGPSNSRQFHGSANPIENRFTVAPAVPCPTLPRVVRKARIAGSQESKMEQTTSVLNSEAQMPHESLEPSNDSALEDPSSEAVFTISPPSH